MSTPAPDAPDPITDDELLYRRIPVKLGYYVPDATPPVSPQAFRPVAADTSGLSLNRARYTTAEQFGRGGGSPEGYLVAVLRVGDLRAQGIALVPTPTPEDPGHADVPALTYQNRHGDETETLKLRLARSVIRVEGPFLPNHPRPPRDA